MIWKINIRHSYSLTLENKKVDFYYKNHNLKTIIKEKNKQEQIFKSKYL